MKYTLFLKIEALPIEYGPLGVGAVWQQVDGTNFEAHREAGAVVRIKGKPTENTFAKADTRYFPETNTVEGYAFVDRKRFFADCLWGYNTETGTGSYRTGIDFKLTKNVSAGVEAKLTGKIDELKEDYAGVRLKLSF